MKYLCLTVPQILRGPKISKFQISIAHAGITWHESSRWNLIKYLVIPIAMFPIQYMQLFGAIINNEGRFVLDLIDPLKKWLLGKVSTTKTHFGMHWAKIHASPGELWMRSRNKKIIKARDGITSPISPSQPVCIGHRFFALWVGRWT